MLYKGNNKIKKLYKGDELIVQLYKGDEKIFEDFEAIYGFKFTIDTRLQNSATPNNTDATFNLPFFKEYNRPRYGKVLWGDGTEDTYTDQTSGTHTYSEPGVYQVTLLPTQFENGKVKKGWLNGSPEGHSYKITSIDTPYPVCGVNVYIGYNGTPEWNRRTFNSLLNGLSHLESIPQDIFKNVEVSVVTSPANNAYEGLFGSMFYNCGRYATGVIDMFTPLKELIQRVDFSKAKSLKNAFANTFYYANWTRTPIPSDLFVIDSPLCTNFDSMFWDTFSYNSSPTTATVAIPSKLFGHIDTSSGTNFSRMFFETFYRGNTPSSFSLAEDMFDGLDISGATNVTKMFFETFGYISGKATSIPEKLFWPLDTSGITDFTEMFSRTFQNYGASTNQITIPEKLFSHLNTSSGTVFKGMFQETFQNFGYNDNTTTILPEDLFDIDTSSGTDFSAMFQATFDNLYRNNSVCEVPSIFKHLDVSNGLNFSSMFASVFHWAFYNGSHKFASDLFTVLNTQNGVNFSGIFAAAFSSVKLDGRTLPAGFFGIDTKNGTNFSNMFGSCFDYSNLRIDSLPDDFFSFNTSNGTNFQAMFYSVFRGCGIPNNITTTLPKVFDIDTTKGENFSRMFYNMFEGVGHPNFSLNRVSIPADYFAFLDTSNGTNFQEMFYSVFPTGVVSAPLGLFGGLTISSTANVTAMFSRTFSIWNGSFSTPFAATLYDVFDGMTDFSWATVANAASVFNQMFWSKSGGGPLFTGNASDILQHFNFTPDTDTNMFAGQVNLSDYATINANWK